MNNASEVRSDVDVAVALTKTYEGLTVSIDKTNNGNGDGKNGNTKISNDGKLASTLIAEAGSQEYVVTVAWDYAKGLTKDAGQSTTLSIDINGTQHNDQNTLTTSDTAAKS